MDTPTGEDPAHDQPDLDFSWVDEDPGECVECGQAWEIVRPGKSQPTCDCQDKCPMCGTLRQHYALGEIAKLRGGFLCPVCDADPKETT